MNKVDQIHHYFVKWSVPINDEFETILLSYFQNSVESKNSFIEEFFSYVKELAPEILKAEETTISSFVYFSISYLLGLCHYQELKNKYRCHVDFEIKRRSINMALICLLIDVAVDEIEEENKDILKKILNCLMLEKEFKSEKRIYRDIYNLAKEILKDLPEFMFIFIKSLENQLNSEFQKKDGISYEELYQIEFKKGQSTVELFQMYLFNDVNVGIPPNFGLLQLFDDLLDYNLDLEAGIKTLVTEEMKYRCNLDEIFFLILKTLDELSPNYWPFKFIVSQILLTKLGTENFSSPELLSCMKSYIPSSTIGVSVNCDMFRKNFYKHIFFNLEK